VMDWRVGVRPPYGPARSWQEFKNKDLPPARLARAYCNSLLLCLKRRKDLGRQWFRDLSS
jgi:hypothetical protein